MYYTDAEVYSKLNEGVSAKILAQLNGCDIKEIRLAERRHSFERTKRDEYYNKNEGIRRKKEAQQEAYINSLLSEDIEETAVKADPPVLKSHTKLQGEKVESESSSTYPDDFIEDIDMAKSRLASYLNQINESAQQLFEKLLEACSS